MATITIVCRNSEHLRAHLERLTDLYPLLGEKSPENVSIVTREAAPTDTITRVEVTIGRPCAAYKRRLFRNAVVKYIGYFQKGVDTEVTLQ